MQVQFAYASVNSFVLKLLDLAVPFLFSCLYCSIMDAAKEKPLIVIHFDTIISISLLCHQLNTIIDVNGKWNP